MRLLCLVGAMLGLFGAVGCTSPPADRVSGPPIPSAVTEVGSVFPSSKDRVETEELWISDATFADSGHGWLVLNERILLATTNGGESWNRVTHSPGPLLSIKFASPTKGWGLISGRIVRTEDGGRTWHPVQAQGDLQLHRLGLVDGLPTWASSVGHLYRSSRAGQTWSEVQTPCQKENPNRFSFLTAVTGWIICEGDVKGSGWVDKQLYKTSDAGLHWELVAKGGMEERAPGMPGGYVGDLFFLNERRGWYGQAGDGALYETNDAGRTWQRNPALGGQQVSSIHFTTPRNGSLVNLDLSIYRLLTTSDGGANWVERYKTPLPARLR